MEPGSAASIDAILDYMAISAVINAYPAHMDRRHWDAYAAIFADHISIEFPEWTAGDLPRRQSRAQWVETVRSSLSGFEATEHLLTSIMINQDGDHATADAHMVALHVYERESFHNLGGFYRFGLVRENRKWRIDHIMLDATWDEGDRTLWAKAHERYQASLAV